MENWKTPRQRTGSIWVGLFTLGYKAQATEIIEKEIKDAVEQERQAIIAWLKMVGCPHVGGIEAGSHIPIEKKAKFPSAKEIIELARAQGYDSFGLVADPELREPLEDLIQKHQAQGCTWPDAPHGSAQEHSPTCPNYPNKPVAFPKPS